MDCDKDRRLGAYRNQRVSRAWSVHDEGVQERACPFHHQTSYITMTHELIVRVLKVLLILFCLARLTKDSHRRHPSRFGYRNGRFQRFYHRNGENRQVSFKLRSFCNYLSEPDYTHLSTAVATNALLERKGHKYALLITKGFKDLLLIGNQSRPKMFDLNVQHPSSPAFVFDGHGVRWTSDVGGVNFWS